MAVVALELWPQRDRRRPVDLGKLEAPRVAHRDAVGRGERIADQLRGLDGIASRRLGEPLLDLRGAGLGWIRGLRVERREIEGEGRRHSALRGLWAGLYATTRSPRPGVSSERRATHRRTRAGIRRPRPPGRAAGASARGRRPRTRPAGARGPVSVMRRAVADESRSDVRAAKQQRRTANRLPHGPEVRWRRRVAEWRGDARVVDESPTRPSARCATTVRVRCSQSGVGQRPERRDRADVGGKASQLSKSDRSEVLPIRPSAAASICGPTSLTTSRRTGSRLRGDHHAEQSPHRRPDPVDAVRTARGDSAVSVVR